MPTWPATIQSGMGFLSRASAMAARVSIEGSSTRPRSSRLNLGGRDIRLLGEASDREGIRLPGGANHVAQLGRVTLCNAHGVAHDTRGSPEPLTTGLVVGAMVGSASIQRVPKEALKWSPDRAVSTGRPYGPQALALRRPPGRGPRPPWRYRDDLLLRYVTRPSAAPDGSMESDVTAPELEGEGFHAVSQRSQWQRSASRTRQPFPALSGNARQRARVALLADGPDEHLPSRPPTWDPIMLGLSREDGAGTPSLGPGPVRENESRRRFR